MSVADIKWTSLQSRVLVIAHERLVVPRPQRPDGLFERRCLMLAAAAVAGILAGYLLAQL
jgi:hypothetical protein